MEEVAVNDKEATGQNKEERPRVPEREPGEERPKGTWADEAAKARTSDDPRARTPRDAAGEPTTRSFDE
jgi:hypothetical protein